MMVPDFSGIYKEFSFLETERKLINNILQFLGHNVDCFVCSQDNTINISLSCSILTSSQPGEIRRARAEGARMGEAKHHAEVRRWKAEANTLGQEVTQLRKDLIRATRAQKRGVKKPPVKRRSITKETIGKISSINSLIHFYCYFLLSISCITL